MFEFAPEGVCTCACAGVSPAPPRTVEMGPERATILESNVRESVRARECVCVCVCVEEGSG